ncbi:MAG: TIGR03435 family protein [Terracidiphilus sp.]
MTKPTPPPLNLRAKRLPIALGLLVLAVPFLWGQQTPPAVATAANPQAAPLPTPIYDVASIHKFKHDGGPLRVSMKTDPDGLTDSHVRVKALICQAYGLSEYQVSGGPEWVSSDYYDVSAKMDEPTMEMLRTLSSDQKTQVRQQMEQALLADRFKLVVHHETKQFPIYALIVAKSGLKLHESKSDDDYKNGLKGFDGRPGGKGMMRMQSDPAGFQLTAQGLSMDKLAAQLSGQLDSKVQNKTGLEGSYDFTLRYSQEDSPEESSSSPAAPSIFTALQEQLGLKLEATKGPVDVIIIDHIEPPSEN